MLRGCLVDPLRQACAWHPGSAAILHELGLACLQSSQVVHRHDDLDA
jgi:hypothetical protein